MAAYLVFSATFLALQSLVLGLCYCCTGFPPFGFRFFWAGAELTPTLAFIAALGVIEALILQVVASITGLFAIGLRYSRRLAILLLVATPVSLPVAWVLDAAYQCFMVEHHKRELHPDGRVTFWSGTHLERTWLPFAVGAFLFAVAVGIVLVHRRTRARRRETA